MQRKSFADMHCSVAQCLEVIGDWWTMLIVRDAFFGVRRFEQLHEHLGISRNILNQRLTWLVEQGVLEKVPYNERPLRYEYRLTAKGRDLWPVLNAMQQWGDKYAAPNGPPVELVHTTCGKVTKAVLTCARCGEPLTVHTVRAVPGPGDVDGIVAERTGAHPGGRTTAS